MKWFTGFTLTLHTRECTSTGELFGEAKEAAFRHRV